VGGGVGGGEGGGVSGGGYGGERGDGGRRKRLKGVRWDWGERRWGVDG